MEEGSMLFQVVKGLMAQMKDSAIEHALAISHGAMRTYMDRLFRRFKDNSRGEIAAMGWATLIGTDSGDALKPA
jgi:hypothetical protein